MQTCVIYKSMFERYVITNADAPDTAWSGSRWVPHQRGIPVAQVQICNFDTWEDAADYARITGMKVLDPTVQ